MPSPADYEPASPRLASVKVRIERAARAADATRAPSPLLAVSKTFGADAVRGACARRSVRSARTTCRKAIAEDGRDRGSARREWHLIGPLQGNKATEAAARFAWVHTIDRAKIAQRLSAARPVDTPPLDVCIQVNISGEASKSGRRRRRGGGARARPWRRCHDCGCAG